MNKRYNELLKDGRWQMKRIKILERDHFRCVRCGKSAEEGTQLHVHHKFYDGRAPWEYEDKDLITLCEDCHNRIHGKSDDIKPGGLTYDKDTGKLWLRNGRGRSLVWTSQMLSDMRRLFPTTKNDELAGIMGVGVRTMVRKARELGLEKDGEWLSGMWRDHVRMAHMMSRALGYPGRIMPGEHRNPDGEFKAGSVHSQEERRKISEGNRRNWMLHKRERRAKIRRTRGLDDEEKTAFVS